MTSPRERKDHAARHDRFYRRLLSLYPKKFREAYEEPMAQLFHDQWHETSRDPALTTQAKFWLRILADTGKAAGFEHINNLKNDMNATLIKPLLRRPNLTFTKLFGATFLLFAGVLVIQVLVIEPRVFSSTARLTVEKPSSSLGETDPFFIQTEFERIKSKAVLTQVVDELGLSRRLRQPTGGALLTSEEASEMLKGMMALRQLPKTSLIEVNVFNEDRHVAAAIANQIVDVYQRQSRAAGASRKIEVVDPAEPGRRPVRPNVPLSLFLIAASGFLFAALAAFLIRRLASARAVEGASV